MRRRGSQGPGELDVVSLIRGLPGPGALQELLRDVSRPQVGHRPEARPARWVPSLMAVAVVMLFAGLREGLVYLGLPLPAGGAILHEDRGELMVLGFWDRRHPLLAPGSGRRPSLVQPK